MYEGWTHLGLHQSLQRGRVEALVATVLAEDERLLCCKLVVLHALVAHRYLLGLVHHTRCILGQRAHLPAHKAEHEVSTAFELVVSLACKQLTLR